MPAGASRRARRRDELLFALRRWKKANSLGQPIGAAPLAPADFRLLCSAQRQDGLLAISRGLVGFWRQEFSRPAKNPRPRANPSAKRLLKLAMRIAGIRRSARLFISGRRKQSRRASPGKSDRRGLVSFGGLRARGFPVRRADKPHDFSSSPSKRRRPSRPNFPMCLFMIALLWSLCARIASRRANQSIELIRFETSRTSSQRPRGNCAVSRVGRSTIRSKLRVDFINACAPTNVSPL